MMALLLKYDLSTQRGCAPSPHLERYSVHVNFIYIHCICAAVHISALLQLKDIASRYNGCYMPYSIDFRKIKVMLTWSILRVHLVRSCQHPAKFSQ